MAAVLEAAAHVLEAHGYEGATIARIADRAGVSVGSVYPYFETKIAVFEALTDELLRRLLEATTPVITEPSLSLGQRVELAFSRSVAVLLPYPTVLRQLAAATGTSFNERLKDARSVAVVAARQLLDSHSCAEGATDLDLAARLLVDVSEGILLNLRRHDDPAVIAREGRRFVEGYCRAP